MRHSTVAMVVIGCLACVSCGGRTEGRVRGGGSSGASGAGGTGAGEPDPGPGCLVDGGVARDGGLGGSGSREVLLCLGGELDGGESSHEWPACSGEGVPKCEGGPCDMEGMACGHGKYCQKDECVMGCISAEGWSRGPGEVYGGCLKCVAESAPCWVSTPGKPCYQYGLCDAKGECRLDWLSAGGEHTCALTPLGEVKCWGRGDSGQLGNGSYSDSAIAQGVVGLGPGVLDVSVGGEHTCALNELGSALCWGNNGSGQLGIGTGDHGTPHESPREPRPMPVSGLPDGLMRISAGGQHTCAWTRSSTQRVMWCWGNNQYGQVGDGTAQTAHVPQRVGSISGSYHYEVASGGTHNCVEWWERNPSGKCWSEPNYCTYNYRWTCWGDNSFGQLGDGSTTSKYAPSSGDDNIGARSPFTAGSRHTCGLQERVWSDPGDSLVCWGDNSYGQLGDGTRTTNHVPTLVPDLSGRIHRASAGQAHTCAITLDGEVLCWGDNSRGQLGDGTTTERHVPTPVVGLSSGGISIAAGNRHTCAITEDGAALC